VAILAVFAAFFFIGPVTGIVVLLVVVVLAGVLLVRLIRANELRGVRRGDGPTPGRVRRASRGRPQHALG
jgi:hypothetical protein